MWPRTSMAKAWGCASEVRTYIEIRSCFAINESRHLVRSSLSRSCRHHAHIAEGSGSNVARTWKLGQSLVSEYRWPGGTGRTRETGSTRCGERGRQYVCVSGGEDY